MRFPQIQKFITASACVFVLTFFGFSREVNEPSQSATTARLDEGDVRIADTRSCKFAPEYQRIKQNKTDPRVAFLELYKTVHDLANNSVSAVGQNDFRDICYYITDQSADTWAAVDKDRGYFQAAWGQPELSDTVAYFSGPNRRFGIIVYVTESDPSFSAYAFTYSNSKWRNVTDEYLAPLHLGQYDFIVLPEYGRTARVLTRDPRVRRYANRFHHKLWLQWTGEKFVPTNIKPTDWRCPDNYVRHFSPEDRAQYCK